MVSDFEVAKLGLELGPLAQAIISGYESSLVQGEVVSVENDRTCTVKVAGDTTAMTRIPYLDSCVPVPGYGVWLARVGKDRSQLLAVGGVRPRGAARAYGLPAATFANGTTTRCTWQTEEFDTMGGFGAPSTDIEIKIPGMYYVAARVGWELGGTANAACYIQIQANSGGSSTGGTKLAYDWGVRTGNTGSGASCRAVRNLQAGDLIDVWASQSSGGALAPVSGAHHSFLEVIYLGSRSV